MVVLGQIYCISSNLVVFGQNGCIRAKVVVLGQSGCNRQIWFYSGKVFVFEQVVVFG